MAVNGVFVFLWAPVVVQHHLDGVVRLLVLGEAQVLLTVGLDAVRKDAILSLFVEAEVVVCAYKGAFNPFQT